MGDRQRRRLEVMRTVVDTLRYQDFRSSFPAEAPGEVPIITALLDDPVSLVFQEFARQSAPGYLVTLGEFGDVVIISLRRSADQGPLTDADDDCPIHPSSEVGMLVEYVARVRGPVRCGLQEPDCEFELVDDGECIAAAG